MESVELQMTGLPLIYKIGGNMFLLVVLNLTTLSLLMVSLRVPC